MIGYFSTRLSEQDRASKVGRQKVTIALTLGARRPRRWTSHAAHHGAWRVSYRAAASDYRGATFISHRAELLVQCDREFSGLRTEHLLFAQRERRLGFHALLIFYLTSRYSFRVCTAGGVEL